MGAPHTHPPRLLDQVRLALHTRHYSRRTEGAYVQWIRRFIVFHDERHPAEMGENEIAAFADNLPQRSVSSAGTTRANGGSGGRYHRQETRQEFSNTAVATHRLEDGYEILTIEEQLGQADVSTTMIYTHVLNTGGLGIRGAADRL